MTEPQAIRRDFWILIAAAALFFSANAGALSLHALDDCHYAQKGVEMAERGAFFTVTWGGDVNPQHAPLQFWFLARSFAVFGFNDFAARLPSLLMALGILWCVFDIGRRTVGPTAALVAMALLLVTNEFLQNGRRCMLEVPTAFWVSLFFVCYLRGLTDRRWHLLLAIPLAAGFLTKSVVGLMPLPVVAACWLRRDLRPPSWTFLATGLALGLAGASSWTVQQGVMHGWDGMREHYFKEVGRRSLESSGLFDFALKYPGIMLREFQPVVVPGLLGACLIWRRGARRACPLALLLSLWILVWVGVANFSSARISRYVWPALVPMALLGGQLLVTWWPRASRLVSRAVVPTALVVAAVVFWVSPRSLSRDMNAPFKSQADVLRTAVPASTRIPLLGEPAWRLASPLLYYGHQMVGPVATEVMPMVQAAWDRPRPLLLLEKRRRGDLVRQGVAFDTVLELRDWQLVELTRAR